MTAENSASAQATEVAGSQSSDWIIYLAEHFPALVWAIGVVGLFALLVVVATIVYLVFSDRPISSKWITIGERVSHTKDKPEWTNILGNINQDVLKVKQLISQEAERLRAEEANLTQQRAKLHQMHGAGLGDMRGGNALQDRINHCREDTTKFHDTVASKLEEIINTLEEIGKKQEK